MTSPMISANGKEATAPDETSGETGKAADKATGAPAMKIKTGITSLKVIDPETNRILLHEKSEW